MELKQQLGADYATKLRVIESKTREIWEKGELYHTYYTLHGMKHSDAVINILDLLVDGLNSEDQLEEIEIFCLLSAAYLHDVGMQRKYPDDEVRVENISKSKNKPYTFQDLIRDEHHLRSGRYIKENFKTLDLDQYESECVRLISEGHRKVDLHLDDYESRAIGFKRVRVRLLSSLLRLADELDIDYRRAPETLYEILKENMPDFSKLQWLKHYYTTGLIIEPIIKEGKRKLSIEINCQYPREDEGRKITEVLILKPIEEKIDKLKTIFLEYGLKIDLTYKLKMNLDLSEIPEYLYNDEFGQNLKVSIELPRTKGFVGRNDKLNELLNSLDRNVIVIEGIPGIGKTYISAKFAEELKERFDVYWYGNLSEVSNLSSVLRKFAYFLKGKNKPRLANSIENFGYNDNDVLISLLKEELNSSNFAIFLDDYHKAEKELNPLLRELLSIESSKIIVITRYEPKFYNSVDKLEKRVSTVKIDSWNLDNTKMMLEARGIETSESVLKEIHERLHGHPQYLNLFCILALNSSAEKLLLNVPRALKEAYDYLETEVYDSLSPSEKMLLQTIAIFRVPETIEAFDSVNESKDSLESLDELINKLLVNEIGSNTFKVHDIICDYCLSDPKKKTLRRYHENAANYYLSLSNEPEDILESVYHFEKAGLLEKSFNILIVNTENFISKGYWDKIEIQLKNSINFFQRKTQPNVLHLVALANLSIGSLYNRKGEYDLALKHANQCKLMFTRIKEKNSFELCNLFCSIYNQKGNIEKATEYNEKCFKIAELEKKDDMMAIALANKANLFEDKDNELRLNQYIEALEILESCGDTENAARVSKNIATVHSIIGNFGEAYKFIRKSLEINKEMNALYNIADTKFTFATICFKDPAKPVSCDQIIQCFKDVVETFDKIGHKRGTAEALFSIGDAYRKIGNLELAIKNIQKAFEIYEKINDKEKAVDSLFSIANMHTQNKDFELSIETLRKACNLHSSSNQEKLRENLVISLAEVLLLAGKHKEALDEAYKIIELGNEKNSLNKREQALALFFAIISSIRLNEVNQSSQFLQKIGNLDNKEFEINWNFSDIEPVLTEVGESKQLLLDIIAFFKGETSFPIIRFEDIQILNEDKGTKSKIYHPLVGSVTIAVNDVDLEKLIKQINKSQTINFDAPNIMELERKKALMMLGFLSKKGVYEIQSLEGQKYNLELTKKGSRLLKSILMSEQQISQS